jgi:hypothetical protein
VQKIRGQERPGRKKAHVCILENTKICRGPFGFVRGGRSSWPEDSPKKNREHSLAKHATVSPSSASHRLAPPRTANSDLRRAPSQRGPY